MDAPVAVDELRHAEVDALRDDRVGLGVGERVRRHQELARLRVRVVHRQVDVRVRVDVARVGGELLEVVGEREAVDDPRVRRLAEREVEDRLPRQAERRLLVHRDLELAGDRRLDRRAVELAVALRGVRVAHREERARHLHRVVHRRPLADPLVVEVAARRHRGDRVDRVVRRRREAHAADVHVDRDLGRVRAHRVRDRRLLRPPHRLRRLGEAHVVVRHAGARVGVVVARRALGVGERRPAELVRELGVHLAALLDDLVDRDHLVVAPRRVGEVARVEGGAVGLVRARLEPPPRGGVRAVRLAVLVRPRHQVDDLDREDVARHGALHVDRARHHVHAIAAARRAAALLALLRRRPLEHALHARVAEDHLVVVVARVVRGHLDRHRLARRDHHLRRLGLREVAPVHVLRAKRQPAVRRGLLVRRVAHVRVRGEAHRLAGEEQHLQSRW